MAWYGGLVPLHLIPFCLKQMIQCQIFTIHATRYGCHFPLVYCLLPSKSRETYGRVFTLLKTKSEELGIELKPKTMLSDFELSIIPAAQLAFPMAALRGCFFHFCQCLIRKVQCLGLQTNYRENPELKSFIRKTAALAFVPRQYVRSDIRSPVIMIITHDSSSN